MAKQVHIRVDDAIYEELSDYSAINGQSLQDSLSIAIRQLLVKSKEEQPHKDTDYTFIDLFAGIGGMRIAYEAAGGHCVYSNEWNKYSQQTYYANFGEQPDGDITKVNAEDIPDHDILVAGFPCQPILQLSVDNDGASQVIADRKVDGVFDRRVFPQFTVGSTLRIMDEFTRDRKEVGKCPDGKPGTIQYFSIGHFRTVRRSKTLHTKPDPQ